MIRRSVPTSVTVALTILGTVLGMKISALTQNSQPPLLLPSEPQAPQAPSALLADSGTVQAMTSKDASSFYPITLIGEDGSRTPFNGKSLLVDLGDKRLLEIRLERYKEGYLHMWAPLKREDKYWHQTIFRPGCANSFFLELFRHDLDPDSSASKTAVLYEGAKPPHKVTDSVTQ